MSARGVRAHGSGQIDALFPDGAPTTTAPWLSYNRRRGYDQSAVTAALSRPPGTQDLQEYDPRTLKSSQPGVTRAGVAYYMGSQYETTGTTYADQGNVGNRHPVVYEREDGSERILLSGHHRATAALLKGQPLRARRVRGR